MLFFQHLLLFLNTLTERGGKKRISLLLGAPCNLVYSGVQSLAAERRHPSRSDPRASRPLTVLRQGHRRPGPANLSKATDSCLMLAAGPQAHRGAQGTTEHDSHSKA